MSDYGVQQDGSFKRKHIDEIESDLKTQAREVFGSDVDLEQGSPIKQFVDLMVVEQDRLWQALEENYYISFYEDAFGDNLDRILSLAGFSREQRRSATGEVTFSTSSPNAANVEIPQGTEVQTASTETKPAIPFKTTRSEVLESGETSVTVPVVGLGPGEAEIDTKWLGSETNVPSNTINTIVNPIAGIDSVTNPQPTGDEELGFVEGRDRETDAEFKLRYNTTLAEGGVSTMLAMESSIMKYDEDIKSVRVEERHDTQNNEYGPEVVVLAPKVSDDRIAEAVLKSRAAGVNSYGSDSGTATTEDGRTKTEHFDRATRIGILVDAQLNTSNTFPNDGLTQIENRVITFLGGTARDGIQYPGLDIGEDVVIDQVKKRVMEEQGVVSSNVYIGKDEAGTAQTTDSDDNTETDNSERGVRIYADSDQNSVYVEARLSGNVSGAKYAYLRESDGTVIAQEDINDLSSGDWVRFKTVTDLVSGNVYEIGVDADAEDYTIGLDSDPTYPYDGEGIGVSIIERHRGDLDTDSTPEATRPNVDAVRLNDMGTSDISIQDLDVAMSGIEEVNVYE